MILVEGYGGLGPVSHPRLKSSNSDRGWNAQSTEVVDPICLPFELEREIFEIAASAYPKCVPNLIRVAHRFRQWLEPELYRILRSGEDNIIRPPFLYHAHHPKGLSLLRPSQPPIPNRTLISPHNIGLDTTRLESYGPWVRNILMQNRSALEIKTILEHCPNVSNLAIWIIHGQCDVLIPILTKLADEGQGKLQRLSFDPSSFFRNYRSEVAIPFSLPMFASLTHLEIVNATSNWLKWQELAKMPKLTHLALAGAVHPPLITSVLKECLVLELFIIFDLDLPVMAANRHIEAAATSSASANTGEQSNNSDVDDWQKDCRVVTLESVTEHLEHWEIGAQGGADFWVIGEEMRNSRKASQGATKIS